MSRERWSLWIEFVVIAVVWGIVVGVLALTVPVFHEVFEDFGGSLPAPTLTVVYVGLFVRKWWFAAILAAIAALAGFQYARMHLYAGQSRYASLARSPLTGLVLILLGVLALVCIVASLRLPIVTIGDVVSGT